MAKQKKKPKRNPPSKQSSQSRAQGNRRPGNKKKPNWLIITIVLLIAALLILLTINPASFNKAERKRRTIAEPAFTKEGELSIFSRDNKLKITTIDIEIAESDTERIRGMMYRKSMRDNAGMLFIMEREEMQGFWMKNTYISLDILYLDRNFRIVSIHTFTQPLSGESIPSGKPAAYVLEVKGGFSDQHEIKVGDSIAFSRVTPSINQ